MRWPERALEFAAQALGGATLLTLLIHILDWLNWIIPREHGQFAWLIGLTAGMAALLLLALIAAARLALRLRFSDAMRRMSSAFGSGMLTALMMFGAVRGLVALAQLL